ncbi:hypothetical protein [Methylobacter sp. S3L5C]|uniref:hypothetical protein n=1 Tax=Methylobacter sp. S3L5C TaxID=2839024 RepID=UPI001FAD250C|nr:hypothetical protein [Methylobacter sp. S3L5C]UOA08594.1 hypothetical protein KKZ03_20785 [Methylobacter sp. S3L5C]
MNHQARHAQMDAIRKSGLRGEVDRLEGIIGALSVATSGVAASIDDGEELSATHVDRLFGLLLCELKSSQQRLSLLV